MQAAAGQHMALELPAMQGRIVAVLVATGVTIRLTGVTSARADICGKYCVATNVLIVGSMGVIALEDALDTARKSMRAVCTT